MNWLGSVFESKYRIEAELGSGAMGTVLLARHVKVGRAFAIKLLHTSLSSNANMCERFQREAQLAGRLHHRNCVSVVDVGTHDGRAFIVMELAAGTSLASMLKLDGQPLTQARAFALLRQLCDGLDHAHSLGLIHRDLKPDNIIVDKDGTARIVDFGIALLREGPDSRLTGAGMILGTPQYMAPEVAMGRGYDHRVDLFALGVLCYEMFTGEMPFGGSGVDAVLASISMPTPAMMNVDPLIEAFTHKLMAKTPMARPSSARHARELLDLIEHDREAAARAFGLPISAAPQAIVDEPTPAFGGAPACKLPAQQAATRHWMRAALGATAFVAGTVIGITPFVVAGKVVAQPPRISMAVVDEPTVDACSWRSATAERGLAIISARREFTLRRTSVNPEPRLDDIAPLATAAAVVEPRLDDIAPLATVEPIIVSDANAVARQYAAVGRKLKAMSDTAATDEMWRAYRRIRIYDAMATDESRLETGAILRDLDGQLAQRDN